jgi:hypothetical protein
VFDEIRDIGILAGKPKLSQWCKSPAARPSVCGRQIGFPGAAARLPELTDPAHGAWTSPASLSMIVSNKKNA